MNVELVRINRLEGEIIIDVRVTEDKSILGLKTESGDVFVMNHEQDCCEHVYLEDICGDLNDIIGEPITMAEVDYNMEEEDWEVRNWTFYKIGTRKGSVTLRWVGESNGYYSTSVDIFIVEPAMYPTVEEFVKQTFPEVLLRVY